MDFFVKHFLEAYRGVALAPAEREALRAECAAIVDELAAEPRVLCHRDYHSRNLMLRDGRLCIIDFQDARLGPDTYDLVSLLRDSYVDLPGARRRRAASRTSSRCRAGPAKPRAFRRRFDLMALQRNLKALGTFGYQTTARQQSRLHPVHAAHAEVRARDAAQDDRFARLGELLAAHIDELR